MLSTIGSIANQNNLLTWDKYTAIPVYSPNWGAFENVDGLSDQTVYPSYVLVGGRWEVSGVSESLYDTPAGTLCYRNEDPLFKKVYWLWVSGETVRRTVSRYSGITDVVLTGYSQGTLVQADIRAPLGTYPDNGVYTDGFWYVKRV